MQSPVTPATPVVSRSQRSQNTTPQSSSSAARLWRPAAQRNLKNQWSKLNALRRDWRTASSAARCHATAIVNSYLSKRYMNGMDFGVLRDMANIREKACSKLSKQQELCNCRLLSSYKDMVRVAVNMAIACKSMGCYLSKSSNSLLTQFSFSPENKNDSDDFGGIPVFAHYSISSFEELAWEIAQMFASELTLKRLLVLEFLSLRQEKVDTTELNWADEFYDGEFEDLHMLKMYSDEAHAPVTPCIRGKSSTCIKQSKQLDSTVLQVYLTSWMVDMDIDDCRVEEIFGVVGREMDVDFLRPSG